MTHPDLRSLRQLLRDADIEVYRSSGDELHVAERIRMHIMDSGIRVRAAEAWEVAFVARAQRGDFPQAPEAELFQRLRDRIGKQARERGYEEGEARVTRVTDPVDPQRVLDTWYEIPYRKGGITEPSLLLEEVRWALEAERVLSA